MRFAPEANHGGNAGLGEARDLLEAVKAAHPTLTYADIYTFAGKVSAETMGCPTVSWKEGRADFAEGEGVTPDGRLPDAGQGTEHLRDVFNRMGFNDQEIVALSGAHCLGFCHDDRSGFSGPWTDTPTEFNNKYFTFLLNKKWVLKNWDGMATSTYFWDHFAQFSAARVTSHMPCGMPYLMRIGCVFDVDWCL